MSYKQIVPSFIVSTWQYLPCCVALTYFFGSGSLQYPDPYCDPVPVLKLPPEPEKPTAILLSLLQHLSLIPGYSDHDSFLPKGQQAEFGKDLLPGTCCAWNTSPLPMLLTPATELAFSSLGFPCCQSSLQIIHPTEKWSPLQTLFICSDTSIPGGIASYIPITWKINWARLLQAESSAECKPCPLRLVSSILQAVFTYGWPHGSWGCYHP